MIVANNGEVLFKKATLDRDISLIAMLNTKKVMVPDIALIMTSLHCYSVRLVKSTLFLIAIKKEIKSCEKALVKTIS